MEYVYWAVGIWCACGAAVWLWSVLYLGQDMFDKSDWVDLVKFTLAGPLMFFGVKKAYRDMKEIRAIKDVMRGVK